jgi:hypothetical protein
LALKDYQSQEVVVTDASSKRVADAVQLVSSTDISTADQLTIINMFGNEPHLANLFLAINNVETRAAWVKSQLAKEARAQAAVE